MIRPTLAAVLIGSVVASSAPWGEAADKPLPPSTIKQAEAYRLFLEAQDRLGDGNPKEARKLLEQVTALDPNSASIRAALARLCLKDGDLTCAEQQARQATALDPTGAEAHKVLAELLFSRYRKSNDTTLLNQGFKEVEAAVTSEPLDTTLWVAWIRLLGAEGRVDEAVAVAKRAAATPGIDPAAPWMSLSRVLLARGETERAIKLLDDVTVTGRAAVPLYETLADLKGSRGDQIGQEQVLTKLRQVKPDDIDAAQRLGAVRLELGDPFGALEPLQATLAARPADPLARRDLARALIKLGRGAEAIPLLESLPQVYRSSHTLLLWAQAAEQAGNPKLAADKLEELITRLSSEDSQSFGPAVRLRAAQARLKQGDPSRALALIAGIDGDISALQIQLSALDALGRAGDAAKELQKRLDERPGDPALIAVLAIRAKRAADDDGPGLEVALGALRSVPDKRRSAADVARWLGQLDRAPLGAKLLDAVGVPEAPSAELLRARATTLDAAGRSGEAEAALRQLLALQPDNDSVLNDLGFLLTKEGRSLDEAIKLLERAVALKPEEPAYLDSLGWALHRSGRSAEALPILRRAARRAVERDEPDIREHLGDVYYALGDAERARAEWSAALSLGASSRSRVQKKLDEMVTAAKAAQP